MLPACYPNDRARRNPGTASLRGTRVERENTYCVSFGGGRSEPMEKDRLAYCGVFVILLWSLLVVDTLCAQGNVSFIARRDFATGANPVSVAVGDFNGDGHPDLATANSGGNTVSILLGQG